jgi:short-subunit dehydrogenase
VTVIHPGGVRTNIAKSARIAAVLDPVKAAAETERFTRVFLRLPPERAGAAIVDAIERRKKRLLIGGDAHMLAWLQRLMPVNYWKVMKGTHEKHS